MCHCFATSLCYGQDVISTHHDSQKMTQHLIDCLEAQKIIPFTSAYEEKSQKFTNEEAIHMHVLPLQGPVSALMIQCDGCCEWYHKECDQSIKEH